MPQHEGLKRVIARTSFVAISGMNTLKLNGFVGIRRASGRHLDDGAHAPEIAEDVAEEWMYDDRFGER